MTFSEFAQMLFPYLSKGISSAEFIVVLTTQIMDKTFTDSDDDLKKHPLERKKDDTLTKIFNGSKPLSQKDAQIILAHLNKLRFQGFLSESSDDLTDLIREAMLKSEIMIEDNVIDTCTDLFVATLEDCASTKPKLKPTKKDSLLDNAKNQSDLSNDIGGAQLSIPDKYKRCVFCIKWKGNADHAYKIISGTYGTCMMYNRDELSTGGVDCKDYEPNYVRVNNQMLLHK